MSEKLKRQELLQEFKSLHKNISRAQRKALWESVSHIISKPTFNQMFTGVFLSSENYPTAVSLMIKLKEFIAYRDAVHSALSKTSS